MRSGLLSLVTIACTLAGCSNTHRAPVAPTDGGDAEADGSARDAGYSYEPPPPVDFNGEGWLNVVLAQP